ncbi:MAG: septal ring lytic transglycosylase RlpA family protein [Thermoanaerobaculia bacterium]
MTRRRISTLFTVTLLLLTGCRTRPNPAAETAETARPGDPLQGLASWYGGRDGFEGKPTASGEIYDSSQLTAAHRELPFGTILKVTNARTGKTVRVRINDRGPFIRGRILDLSRAAAEEIGLIGPGVAEVRATVVLPGVDKPETSATGFWAVQVGSFADRYRAERHAERVRETGRGVFLEPYRGLSRVKVGPYDSRAQAETALEEIREAGFEGIVVPAGGRK